MRKLNIKSKEHNISFGLMLFMGSFAEIDTVLTLVNTKSNFML